MNIYYLSAELFFDTVALILGLILLYQRSDNQPKFYWGVIASLIGCVFISENIMWVITQVETPGYEYCDILNIEKMIKFNMLASMVSLYPLASLRPGYLTKFRFTLYMIPPIIITTIGICYLQFNGSITTLYSVENIWANINNNDVQLRLSIFLFTAIIPLAYLISSLFIDKGQRRINGMMYVFIGFLFTLLIIYILFTLFICSAFFNGFGIVSIFFSIFFSVQYMLGESPLSSRKVASLTSEQSNKICTDGNPIYEPLPLFKTIDNYLRQSCDYTNSTFDISALSKALDLNKAEISCAIKSASYSGFKEYLSKLRLEHFRNLILHKPHYTTKELWVECGFPSKATFYRLFSAAYHETPRSFIDKHCNNS